MATHRSLGSPKSTEQVLGQVANWDSNADLKHHAKF
jgi:hypothetical protein